MRSSVDNKCPWIGAGVAWLVALAAAIGGARGEEPTPRSLGDWAELVGDSNADGLVNVLDLAGETPDGWPGLGPRGSGAERLIAELPAGGIPSIPAGETLTFQIRLENSTTPLFGYSLGLELQPVPGSGGSVDVLVDQTSFYEPQNLIVAGGLQLDPVFSVILPAGDGGAFINANTDDGSTVLAVPEVNDILAEVVVAASADALGPFTVELSGATALSDGIGLPVPFEYDPLVIEITVAPCSGADLAEPFQILDLNDLVEFVVLFQAQDPRVDFAVPVGVFDLQDLIAFIGFFVAGC